MTNYDDELEDFCESVFNTALIPKKHNGYVTVCDTLDFLRLKCEEYGYDLEEAIGYYDTIWI